VRRSARTAGDPEATPQSGGASPDLFLVDTMGEAEAATALADVVLPGRSWNGLGGSNPVPAALLGKPLVVGPDHQNFAEMVAALREAGALSVVDDPWAGVAPILNDGTLAARMSAAGPACVRAHVGATARNVALVRRALDARGGEKVPEEQRLPR
jgi:3-deoxy-D-manno-octulosonic-acid transferase